MAPYSSLLQGMSNKDKKIVIMFLTESLVESVENDNNDKWLEESLAKFHDDWGGSGTPMEIAEELRNGVVNSRTVEDW